MRLKILEILLGAAGDGASMADRWGPHRQLSMAVSGPTSLRRHHTAARRPRFVWPESLAREKAKPTGYEENNHWLAARPQALRLWPVKKDEDEDFA